MTPTTPAGQMAGHTRVFPPSNCQAVEGFCEIAHDFGDGSRSLPLAYVRDEETAHLYAAAPQMLEALKGLVTVCVRVGPTTREDVDAIHAARSAITLATQPRGDEGPEAEVGRG